MCCVKSQERGAGRDGNAKPPVLEGESGRAETEIPCPPFEQTLSLHLLAEESETGHSLASEAPRGPPRRSGGRSHAGPAPSRPFGLSGSQTFPQRTPNCRAVWGQDWATGSHLSEML